MARVAAELERQEIVTRQRRILGEMRQQPKHATSWMQNEPTGSVEEAAERTADMVMRLRRADPQGSKPRWAM